MAAVGGARVGGGPEAEHPDLLQLLARRDEARPVRRDLGPGLVEQVFVVPHDPHVLAPGKGDVTLRGLEGLEGSREVVVVHPVGLQRLDDRVGVVDGSLLSELEGLEGVPAADRRPLPASDRRGDHLVVVAGDDLVSSRCSRHRSSRRSSSSRSRCRRRCRAPRPSTGASRYRSARDRVAALEAPENALEPSSGMAAAEAPAIVRNFLRETGRPFGASFVVIALSFWLPAAAPPKARASPAPRNPRARSVVVPGRGSDHCEHPPRAARSGPSSPLLPWLPRPLASPRPPLGPRRHVPDRSAHPGDTRVTGRRTQAGSRRASPGGHFVHLFCSLDRTSPS